MLHYVMSKFIRIETSCHLATGNPIGKCALIGDNLWAGWNPTGQLSLGIKICRRWFAVRTCWAHKMNASGIYRQWGPFQYWNLNVR